MTLLASDFGSPHWLPGRMPEGLLCVHAAKFWIYWAFTFMTLTFFTMYGMMTVAISPNVQVSCLVSVLLSALASY